MRYWIKFSKKDNQKYISHKEMHKVMERIINRSGLAVSYSEGFNPHQKISFSNPLELGIESEAEYLDIEFIEEMEDEEILTKLNANSLPGIEFYQAEEFVKWAPKLMSWIELAQYTIKIEKNDKIKEAIKNILTREEIFIKRRRRRHLIKVNIRSYIKDISFDENELKIILSTGQKGNLKLSQFVNKFNELSGYNLDSHKILKTEVYGLHLSQYIRPFELLRQLKD